MLNIINYQRKGHQNYNEISLHKSQNSHHQKFYKKKKNTGEGVVKMELIYSVGEMNVGTVIIENGMEAP